MPDPPPGAASYSAPPPPPGKGKRSASPGRYWRSATLIGVLALFLIAALSAMSGYRSGIGLRTEAEATQVAARIDEQYELGLQELAAGQYFRARQRFEYVIEHDPNFPGVTDNLATVLLQLNTTATPTVRPTPTVTPTPDLRGVEELYSQSLQSLTNSDWTAAIDTLLSLRKADQNFHPVEVDGMLFLALRNRGIDKIGKQADLEGGLYDLALAAEFGPLDSEAQGYKTWASLYITGASFWDLNWEEAVRYFEQVAPALPRLRDGSGMTASERYRQALIGYGHQLSRQAEDDPSLWCSAVEKYEMGLSFGPDAEAEAALNDA
jgi:tetratricopeptide (TPR) repeat protein